MIQPFCKRKLLSVIKVVVDIRNADARIQTGNLIKRKQMQQGKGGLTVWQSKARCGYKYLPTGETWTPSFQMGHPSPREAKHGCRFRKGKWIVQFTMARCAGPQRVGMCIRSSLSIASFGVESELPVHVHVASLLLATASSSDVLQQAPHSSLMNWL